MWFKNARLFQLDKDFAIDSENLDEALKAKALKPCGPQQLSSAGWVSPFGPESDLFVLQSGQGQLFCLGEEEKILPPTVVNHHLQEKLASIKKETGSPVGRQHKTELKQQLIFELLPQAFVKPKRTQAYFDNALKLLVVDSASQNAAENLVSHLRDALGSMTATPFAESLAVSGMMTTWLNQGRAEAGLTFGHEAVLEDTQENGGVIRARKVDVLADEMQSHLENGYTVKEMGLVYNERIEFVLGNDLAVRKIKLTDVVLDQLDHAVMESDAQMLDTHFTLLSLELRELFKTIFRIFPVS